MDVLKYASFIGIVTIAVYCICNIRNIMKTNPRAVAPGESRRCRHPDGEVRVRAGALVAQNRGTWVQTVSQMGPAGLWAAPEPFPASLATMSAQQWSSVRAVWWRDPRSLKEASLALRQI